jgi:outer membrane protein assembly factor BamA
MLLPGAHRHCSHTLAWLILFAGAAGPQAGARVLPAMYSRSTASDATRPPGVPGDVELELRGARIGDIRITRRQLFDVDHPDEDSSLSRVANRLHIPTRDATIADQLLFKAGDPYRAGLLEESARILRDTRYLRDAQVRPVAWHDGVVDVEVSTQDVWTFNPGFSFGRKGGRNTGGLALEELNFLGLGTQVGLALTSGVDRDTRAVYYRDRQMGSSWWDLSTLYSDNSDGRLAEFSLSRPFYALDSRWAAGVALTEDQRIDSRYDLGEVVDHYQSHDRLSTIYWGRSSGLVQGWARRYSFGVSVEDRDFEALAGANPTRLLPTDRRLAYPWAAVEWIQNDFRTARNRDQIGRIEDYSLGWRARTMAGFAGTTTGSDRDALMLNASLGKGWALSTRQSLLFDAEAGGRVERGGIRGGKLGAGARYYFRQSPMRLLFVELSGEAGANLDADQQILLGGDNGLRGYPLRYQAGAGRWLFTAEQRFFTHWYPFRLFNVGAAVFYDMGATWGRDPLGAPSRGLLRDVGIGLRLGNSRSALGNVLHLDLAFPLDGDATLQGLQLLVETRKSF